MKDSFHFILNIKQIPASNSIQKKHPHPDKIDQAARRDQRTILKGFLARNLQGNMIFIFVFLETCML